MKIKEKVNMTLDGLIQNGPITIVAFGDSITHGAVSLGEFDYEGVYWNRLRKKILSKRNYIPVNVINAGIGGLTAFDSLSRLDKQVLSHCPDLVIVCFGLNDINGKLDTYLNSLRVIFSKIKESGADIIFMTPNMLNTYVAEDTPKRFFEYAQKTAKMQNDGTMDLYMNEAISLARELQIPVSDCYSQWKELSKTKDTTMLLANRINHPISEMHELFADSLMEIIFDEQTVNGNTESAMYEEKS